MAMKVFFELHTKKSPRVLSTQVPVDMSAAIFKEPDVESRVITVIDYNVAFEVSSDKGEGDECSPGKINACNIPVTVTLICFGVFPSIAKLAIERRGRAYMEGYVKIGQYPFNGKAAEFIVTGTEGCAHDVFYMNWHIFLSCPRKIRSLQT